MEFVVLYTHQKTKKSKVWQDGFLTIISPNKAALFDANKSTIDTLCIKEEKVIVGAKLESCKYLIQVEECKSMPDTSRSEEMVCGGTAEQSKKLEPAFAQHQTGGERRSTSGSIKSSSTALPKSVARVGLKRRHTGFVPPRQVKTKKNDKGFPTQFQNIYSDYNDTVRQDSDLWNSLQRPFNPNQNRHSDTDYKLTSHDMVRDRNGVTSDMSNSWRLQNDSVMVDMQDSYTGTKLWSQSGTSFYKQRTLNSKTNVECNQRLIAEYNRCNHYDARSSWDKAREKVKKDDRQLQAKRSCSQILVLIGNGQEMGKTSGKEGDIAATGHQKMCSDVDLTSRHVFEVNSVESSERTNISRESPAIQELNQVIKESTVDGVELSNKTEDRCADTADTSNNDTAKDGIGKVSSNVDQLMAETDADSEQVCFDVRFSPLADWGSVNGISDQTSSGDECSQVSHMHTVSQQEHGGQFIESSTNSNIISCREEAGLQFQSEMTESGGRCSQDSCTYTLGQRNSYLTRDKVSFGFIISQHEVTCKNGISCGDHDESFNCDAALDMASRESVSVATPGVESNEPVIDCSSTDISSGRDIVNCHTPEGSFAKRQLGSGNNVICSDGDIVSCDSVSVKCLLPDGNVVSSLTDGNIDCTTAAAVDVICHMDNINTGNCHIDDTTAADYCHTDDSRANYCHTDGTTVDICHTDDTTADICLAGDKTADICHTDDTLADICHADDITANNYHTDNTTANSCRTDDTSIDNCCTNDGSNDTVHCYTGDSDKNCSSQPLINGYVNCCESGNFVICPLPHTDTTSCHPGSGVINDFQIVRNLQNTCSNVDHKIICVSPGDTNHSNTDNVDSEYLHCNSQDNVDSEDLHCNSQDNVDSEDLHCNSQDNVDNEDLHCNSQDNVDSEDLHCNSQDNVDSEDLHCNSQDNVDSEDLHCNSQDNVDSEDLHCNSQDNVDSDNTKHMHNNRQRDVTNKTDTCDSQTEDMGCLFSDSDCKGCHFIDMEDDSFIIDDGHNCVVRESEDQRIGNNTARGCSEFQEDTVDGYCCVSNQDCHSEFGDSSERHRSGYEKVCHIGEKKTDDETDHHGDYCVDIIDTTYNSRHQGKRYTDDSSDYDSHYEGDTGCNINSHTNHQSNNIDEENCYLNKKNNSCLDNKTASPECCTKTHHDNVDTPDGDLANTWPGVVEDDKMQEEYVRSETVSEETILEGDTCESDIEGTAGMYQHVGQNESTTVITERCGDTDSMNTTDTMYSSSQGSQCNGQRSPQQRLMEQNWPLYQHRICLPPPVIKTARLQAAAVAPPDRDSGITRLIVMRYKWQKEESSQVITKETLSRASMPAASPWSACPSTLVATSSRLSDIGRNSKEDIAILAGSRLADYTVRGTCRSATVRREKTSLCNPAREHQTAVTRILTSNTVPHSPELLSWQSKVDESLYSVSPNLSHQKATPFHQKQLFLLSQKPEPMQQVSRLRTIESPVMTETQLVPDATPPPSPVVISPHKVPSTDNLSSVIFSQDLAFGSFEHGMSIKSLDYICGGEDSESVMCPNKHFQMCDSPCTKHERLPLRCQPFEDKVSLDTLTDEGRVHRFTVDDDLDDIEFLAHQQNDDRYVSTWLTMPKTYENVMSPSKATNSDMCGLLQQTQRHVDTSDISQYQMSHDKKPVIPSACHQYYCDTSFILAQDQMTDDVTRTMSRYECHYDCPHERSSPLLGPSDDNVLPQTVENDSNTKWGIFVDTESKSNISASLYHSRFTPHGHVRDGCQPSPALISPLGSSKSGCSDMNGYEAQLGQGTLSRYDKFVCDRSPLLQHGTRNELMQRTGTRTGFKSPALVGQKPEQRVVHRRKAVSGSSSFVRPTKTIPLLFSPELRFSSKAEAESGVISCRLVSIAPTFSSVALYKQVLTAALNEHLNLQLLEVARQFYLVWATVDITSYSPLSSQLHEAAKLAKNKNPICEHGVPSKIMQVKKEGRNKGRYFYSCSNSQATRCHFFKWLDKGCGTRSGTHQQHLELSDGRSIESYFKQRRVALYCECQLILKSTRDTYKSHLKNFPRWVKQQMQLEDKNCRKTLYLMLENRLNSSAYAKDDLWVISQELTFEPGCTFLARSSFHGPSTSNEVEIEPVSGYNPSNWPSGVQCQAIHAGNFSSELTCLANLEIFVNPSNLPLLPQLLSRDSKYTTQSSHSGFMTPACKVKQQFYVPDNDIEREALIYIEKYQLNEDQATSLLNVALMFSAESTAPSVTLVHGVFGSGKSYLLAVVVMFLSRLFELNEVYTSDTSTNLLISSTTNVAVDRILVSLLDLGFDDFVRVGSVKKIAKPILPLSVHALGSQNQELKELQDMLRSDITAAEKVHVRRSIEQLRRGANKQRLGSAHVVGATCAACVFPCMKDFTFQVVLLDECSQMTEPTSLLPIARFHCGKLVLVGDPKQLSPTIQGSEAAHNQGLEQTLFDRFLLMGHQATMLHTQYRCHPQISAIANQLFYECQLKDGITVHDRPPLASGWPVVCFYDVTNGSEQSHHDGSFYNIAEAEFLVKLIDALVCHHDVDSTDIGVITLYRAQVAAILHLLRASRAFKDKHESGVQVSTVDAFQGGERPVIILSCVLTHSQSFLDSDKRTNVALTRAKNHLFIVGHHGNLAKNKLWRHVIEYCEGQPGGTCTSRQMMKLWKENVPD